jgi:hypothetical protein
LGALRARSNPRRDQQTVASANGCFVRLAEESQQFATLTFFGRTKKIIRLEAAASLDHVHSPYSSDDLGSTVGTTGCFKSSRLSLYCCNVDISEYSNSEMSTEVERHTMYLQLI